MKKAILILVFSPVIFLHAQLPLAGADSLMKHYQQKAFLYLGKDSAIGNFYSIDLYGVSVFASAADKLNNKPEYRVTWNELPLYKNMMKTTSRADAMATMKAKGSKPFSPADQKAYASSPSAVKKTVPGKLLYGFKIAIDPGHVADDTVMGRIEERVIHMKTFNGKDSVDVAFTEGELTWMTATTLASQLRAAGAEVMLTRSGPGITAFGKTFEQWKKDDFQRTLDSLLKVDPTNKNLIELKKKKHLNDDRFIFRYVFRDAELRKRADIINAFHPDLSVIIHYNVDEQNKDWTKPTAKDFSMAFVGGGFQQGELSDPERRFDFLRLLLTDDLDKSIYASRYAVREFKNELNVPLAKSTDADYLSKSCMPSGHPGIYCRNLATTRLVQGPLIFGETLYQDNVKESYLLAAQIPVNVSANVAYAGMPRVFQVAQAYYNAILDWAGDPAR